MCFLFYTWDSCCKKKYVKFLWVWYPLNMQQTFYSEFSHSCKYGIILLGETRQYLEQSQVEAMNFVDCHGHYLLIYRLAVRISAAVLLENYVIFFKSSLCITLHCLHPVVVCFFLLHSQDAPWLHLEITSICPGKASPFSGSTANEHFMRSASGLNLCTHLL